jgi:hypothetical protein
VEVPPEGVDDEPEPDDEEEPEEELEPLFEDPPSEVPPLVDAPSPLDAVLAAAVSPPSEPPDFDAFRAAAPRSFFAQPEPLKWIAGGAKPLRTSLE